MQLKDKVAIVTGAGRGIGRQIAIDLAVEGCKIAIISRTSRQLDKVSNEISKMKKNAEVIVIPSDISGLKNIETLVKSVMDRFGKIDILVNNAAILYKADIFETDENIWNSTMGINLKALFFLSQKVLKIMKQRKSGYIINVSSTAALDVPVGIMAYGTSKAAVVGISQALYKEAKEYGVKVSTIYPGMTDTEMLRAAKVPVPPEKWMLPEDISNCVLFLLKQSERVVIKDIIPWAFRHDKI
jgi:3-oxoacyl-[acyl-carrier protein] reductase